MGALVRNEPEAILWQNADHDRRFDQGVLQKMFVVTYPKATLPWAPDAALSHDGLYGSIALAPPAFEKSLRGRGAVEHDNLRRRSTFSEAERGIARLRNERSKVSVDCAIHVHKDH
jgi:hypothetical protein